MKADLDRAIGVTPPSAVNIDEVIGRGRRAVRTRQTWIAVGAGAAVVAALLVLVPLAGGAPAPVPAVGPGTTAVPSDRKVRPTVVHGVPSVAPSGTVPTGAIPGDIKAQLDAALADRIAASIPGVTYVDPAPGHQPPITTFISSYQTSATDDHTYEAIALLKDAAGVSLLRLQVFDAYPFPYSCNGSAACQITRLPDGQQVYRQTGNVEPGGKPQNVAAASKPDGSTVEVEILTDLTGKPITASALKIGWNATRFGKARSQPLLTADQLAEIATDSRFSFHP
jgi:hypothetical protein